MIKWLCPFAAFFFLLGILPAVGQEIPNKKKTYPFRITSKDTSTLHRKQLTFFPIIYRSPETGMAYGMLSLGLFKMVGVTDSLTRTSNFEIPLIYTSHKQMSFDILFNLITNKERFFIRGFNQYNNFNEYYYGIGNQTKPSDQTLVKYQAVRFAERVVTRVKGRHFGGLQYQFYDVWHTSFTDTLLYYQKNDPLGYHGFRTSGLGFIYLFDSRNNVINSKRGAYLEFSNLFAGPALGSQFTFRNFSIDARKYFPIGKGHVLAFQGILNSNEGDLPWRQMAAMGGFNMMRGYYLGRHRDKNYAALQAEYRLHIWKFFGMAFFAATGQVAPSLKDMSFSELKYSGGAGFRFEVDKKERVNIRFDVGFGTGQPGYYLTIGEAF